LPWVGPRSGERVVVKSGERPCDARREGKGWI